MVATEYCFTSISEGVSHPFDCRGGQTGREPTSRAFPTQKETERCKEDREVGRTER